MGHIIAMGGGELREGETLPMDERVVQATGKKRPNALFIPTASGDAVDYYETFRRVYGEQLGCSPDVLWLFHNRPDDIAGKIRWADCIYVGGGNTLRMMKLWRRLGVDKLLIEAYRAGTVLSGLSAGAICWFAYGHSDSMRFSAGDNEWNYVRVRGLGLVDAIYCPHLNGENRIDPFKALMAKNSRMGIGVDDHCALEIKGDTYRVITSAGGAKAYRVYRSRGGDVTVQAIEPSEGYRPLSELLDHR